MQGWIKLHRQFEDWVWFRKSKMVHLFIYLLITANHEKKSWKGIEIERGQLITSRHKLAQKLGLHESTIRNQLIDLQKTGEITIETTNKYSIITICNYETYQSQYIENDQQNGQQNGQRFSQQIGHKQEVKKLRNKKPPLPPCCATPPVPPYLDDDLTYPMTRAEREAFEAPDESHLFRTEGERFTARDMWQIAGGRPGEREVIRAKARRWYGLPEGAELSEAQILEHLAQVEDIEIG